MDRRTFVKGGAAVVGATTLSQRVYAQAAAPDKIRFGYAITQSGPLGPGAESTTVSQYKLWQKRVNDAGGITLKAFNKKVPIDLVGYDDQGKPDELLKLTERLIQSDRVDMILSPYATHMNMASAPVINKYQYPVILSTSASAQALRAGAAAPLRVLAPGSAQRGDPAAVGDDRRPEARGQDQGPRGDDLCRRAARHRAASRLSWRRPRRTVSMSS